MTDPKGAVEAFFASDDIPKPNSELNETARLICAAFLHAEAVNKTWPDAQLAMLKESRIYNLAEEIRVMELYEQNPVFFRGCATRVEYYKNVIAKITASELARQGLGFKAAAGEMGRYISARIAPVPPYNKHVLERYSSGNTDIAANRKLYAALFTGDIVEIRLNPEPSTTLAVLQKYASLFE